MNTTSLEQEQPLGQQMRAARLAQGWSLRELSSRVGISASSLSEFEHGKTRPSPERIAALAHTLQVKMPVEAEPEANAHLVFSNWRRYGPETVGPVLAAGLEVFVERGYHGSTVRMIAERAGITVAGVYHHIESKYALFLELVHRAMEEMIHRVEAAAAEATSATERLTNVVECLVLFHIHRLLWGHLATGEIRAIVGDDRVTIIGLRRRVRQIVEDAVIDYRREAGVNSQVPDLVTARAIVTMTVVIPEWYVDAGSPAPEKVVEDYIQLVEGMVRS